MEPKINTEQSQDQEVVASPTEKLTEWNQEVQEILDALPEGEHDRNKIASTQAKIADFEHASRPQREEGAGAAQGILATSLKRDRKVAEYACYKPGEQIHISGEVVEVPEVVSRSRFADILARKIPADSSDFLGVLGDTIVRQRTVNEAYDNANAVATGRYRTTIGEYFEDAQIKVAAAELDAALAEDVLADYINQVDPDVQRLIGTLKDGLAKHPAITGVGGSEYGDFYRAMNDLNRIFTTDTHKFSELAATKLTESLGLPNSEQNAAEVSKWLEGYRELLRKRLAVQRDSLIEQRNKGVSWSDIDTTSHAYDPDAALKKRVLAEIEGMQEEGQSAPQIHKELARKYMGRGGAEAEEAFKVVSNWYAPLAGKNRRDASKDTPTYNT